MSVVMATRADFGIHYNETPAPQTPTRQHGRDVELLYDNHIHRAWPTSVNLRRSAARLPPGSEKGKVSGIYIHDEH